MTFLAQGLVYYFLVVKVVQNLDLTLHFDWSFFLVLATSTCLIMSGGYVINDLHDQAEDELNNAAEVIVGKHISESQARRLYSLMNLVAILLILFITYHLSDPGLGALMLGSIYLLHLYSKFLKRTVLIGNLTVSFLCALSIWIVMVAAHIDIARASALSGGSSEIFFWIFGGFAFITTLWREIAKDLEDKEGDAQSNIRTLAHVAEGRLSKSIEMILGVTLIVNLFSIIWIAWPFLGDSGRIYAVLLLVAPCLINIKIWQAVKKSDWTSISLWQKVFMVQGLLFIIFWHAYS